MDVIVKIIIINLKKILQLNSKNWNEWSHTIKRYIVKE